MIFVQNKTKTETFLFRINYIKKHRSNHIFTCKTLSATRWKEIKSGLCQKSIHQYKSAVVLIESFSAVCYFGEIIFQWKYRSWKIKKIKKCLHYKLPWTVDYSVEIILITCKKTIFSNVSYCRCWVTMFKLSDCSCYIVTQGSTVCLMFRWI